MRDKELKIEKQKKIWYYDYTMVVLVLLLVAFGLIMVCSSSAYTSVKMGNPATFYFRKQAIFAVVGIVAMLLVPLVDYHILEIRVGKFSLSHILYAAALAMQVVVLVAGSSKNGSARWLEIGGFSFQPSELSKVFMIIIVAYFVSQRPSMINKFGPLFVYGLATLAVFGLIAVENLSTAIIVIAITLVVCFVVSKKWWAYLIAGAGVGGIAVWLITSVGYRSDRITLWLNVESTKDNQVYNALQAICAGGWFGKGLGNSVQKLGHIPEVSNDMVFSVICEELGIIGACILLLIYLLLLWRIMKVAANAPDLFGSLLCIGVFTHIFLQVLLHIAVVTNTLPNTGVTLPFVSYGGTSLMITLAEMGLVINVSNRIEYEE